MTPCVVYTRVSSDEQAKAGYSIGAQEKKVNAFLAGRQLTAVAQFTEAHSAKNPGRPEFERMVSFLSEHEEIGTVVVHKLDRFSRNFIDVGIIRDVMRRRILSVEEPVDDSPTGRLHQNITFSFAAYYSDNLAQEVKKGMRAKFEAGGWCHKAPIGYRNVPRTKTRQARIEPDPDQAPLVRLAFERYATGDVSLQQLALELFDHGLRTAGMRPYSKERMKKMLRHPIYIGMTLHEGELRQGAHDPIVPRDLWDAAQVVLSRRARAVEPATKRTFLLRGLLRCASCGRRMTAEHHPRGSYYRCLPNPLGEPCAAPYARVSNLDAHVEALLPMVQLREEAARQVREDLAALRDEHLAVRDRELRSVKAHLADLDGKLTRLTEGFIDGTVPRAQYERLKLALEVEGATLEHRRRELDRDVDEEVAAVGALLDHAEALSRLYVLAPSLSEKKDLLRTVFETLTVDNKTITNIEYKPEFASLLGDTPNPSGSGKSMAQRLIETRFAREC